ncbi:AraC family transcriptional regulator [Paenibacillus sp. N3.4]|uniref:AraC family transcriptional regulator n=1 Tax=Paenibacillus sp. N3.4 TaxID=2603222 RepID=UPI0011C7FEED|nr:AraC family transcriptional regulator [Paenibacillus sp. N3.4]TXK71679.1 AraC family transcriptional regulator [Paenibacillus sp. N3.4]TXK71685.1 AraC family transcriptional regulator [Paenibacillus sp. N3.4]
MSEIITKQQNELAKLIERYAVQDGVHATAIPTLFFIRRSKLTGPSYGVYKPSLCIVVQGAKEVWLAQERFKYDPADYLIASVDLPVTAQVTEASSDIPYLGFRLEFTASEILDVLSDSEIRITPRGNAERAMFVGQMELPIMDSIFRLARLLDIPFLAPIYTKEILFRLLQGQYGVTLAQIAMEGSGIYGIRDAIEQISNNYDKPLRIEELAEIASMSISSFHRHFKEVTAMSPIQFQKQLRLQEARRLLLTESADAADVAFRVGYESPSQFSREYSRMFGFPPRQDIKRLRV